MNSVLSSPAMMKKCKSVLKKVETASSMTNTATTPNISLTTTTKITDKARWKNEFNAEVLATKNDSLNNPLFTSDRYNQTIELLRSDQKFCNRCWQFYKPINIRELLA